MASADEWLGDPLGSGDWDGRGDDRNLRENDSEKEGRRDRSMAIWQNG